MKAKPPRPRRKKIDTKRTPFIICFLAPACIFYGLFVIWPVLQAFFVSTFRWRGVSSERQFVGLDNFKTLFQDSSFWNALSHSIWILVVAGIVIMVIAMAMAHVLQRETRGIHMMRSVYLIPQVLSLVVVGIIWMFFYNPKFGIVKSSFEFIGWKEAASIPWLADQRFALPAITVVIIWQSLGFYIMLLSTGLKNIPKEVTESAMLDGAKNLTLLRRITLPLMRPILRISVIYLIIGCLNTFAIVFVMNDGQRIAKTDVMLTYLYDKAFRESNYGVATALAVFNFVLVMVLSMVVMRLFKKKPHEEAAL
jgi:ABC-type sugar transport system permease subunit